MLKSVSPQTKHNKVITARMENSITVESITFLEPMIIVPLQYLMNFKRIISTRHKKKMEATMNTLMLARCSLDVRLLNGLKFSGI